MNELLQKLLEADVLSEDTKKELEEAFTSQLNEAVKEAREKAAADVQAELTEQWVQERDTLIEALDEKVGEFLREELDELKEDINRFRDLEAEHAEKLVEAKAQMGEELKGDLAELVEKLDAFLEIRLAAELEELREDLNEAKKKEFGRKIFEAFVKEYSNNYADEESLVGSLRETEERLSDAQRVLEETQRKLARMERNDKMQKVLSPLQGRQREVMEAILRNVPTEQLEEGYKTFVGRVIREAAAVEESTSEKENTVLAEDRKEGSDVSAAKKELKESTGKIVTGDKQEALQEQVKTTQNKLSENARLRLQRLAGLA